MVLRATAVISDLHIGAGALDDCDAVMEAALIAFLRFLADMDRPVELVINGDFLDFAQAPPIDGRDLRGETTDGVRLCFTQPQSLAKFAAICQAHAAIFTALRGFLERNPEHRLVILPGNHDADFFWPKVRERFLYEFPDALHPRIRFHLEQSYLPAHAPNLWIEHGHQYDACNRFRLADVPLWSAKHPPILDDKDGTPRLLECIGTGFMTRFLNRLDESYPFVDNVKPFGRFLELFGASLFVRRHGPWKATVAVWAMLKYLGYTTFTTPRALLSHASDELPDAAELVREFADSLPDHGDQLLTRLEQHGFNYDRSLSMLGANDREAERFLDFAAEHLELLDDDPQPRSLLGHNPGTLTLRGGFKLDESAELRKAAARVAETQPIDTIVMGHTHEFVDATLTRNVRYINIGSWTRYLREHDEMLTWDILRRDQDAHFPFRLCYAWHDPDADPPIRAITFDESDSHGRG